MCTGAIRDREASRGRTPAPDDLELGPAGLAALLGVDEAVAARLTPDGWFRVPAALARRWLARTKPALLTPTEVCVLLKRATRQRPDIEVWKWVSYGRIAPDGRRIYLPDIGAGGFRRRRLIDPRQLADFLAATDYFEAVRAFAHAPAFGRIPEAV